MTTENTTLASEQTDQPDYFTRVNWHVKAAAERARQAKAGIDAALAKVEAALESVRGREAEQRAAEQRVQSLQGIAAAADQLNREVQAQARNYADSLSRANPPISRDEAQTFWQLAEQTALHVATLHENALDR
ncbi:hypothetical protein LL998_33470 (plasmid) [Burkholderia ambifaria]|uniref:hypothetical protein n=1 Tax=Burkholderia ambifaria TaxID=152480 RepID=UPI001E4A35C5|nr:hypothetical protein [Burkholderia ambifaria]UEP39844.1 hypothetical protein LL998_33470 [Burkholderia ambifaria]